MPWVRCERETTIRSAQLSKLPSAEKSAPAKTAEELLLECRCVPEGDVSQSQSIFASSTTWSWAKSAVGLSDVCVRASANRADIVRVCVCVCVCVSE